MPVSEPTSIFKGALLTVLMRWSDRLIGFVSTLILARLLVPEDFGIIAMASLVIGLVDVLLDLGVNVALIQNRHATPDHYPFRLDTSSDPGGRRDSDSTLHRTLRR